ncbi:hypothetical protein [Streptomyces sp. NPDC101150]|uniref:hypothetical protein n=1 Tax=Streptomyces sp. NPDC101150 TaxID=3366114 RepID=UPI003827C0F6
MDARRKSVGAHNGNVHVSVETQWMTPRDATQFAMDLLHNIDRAQMQRTILAGEDPTIETPDTVTLTCRHCDHSWESAVKPGNSTKCPNCKRMKRRSSRP